MCSSSLMHVQLMVIQGIHARISIHVNLKAENGSASIKQYWPAIGVFMRPLSPAHHSMCTEHNESQHWSAGQFRSTYVVEKIFCAEEKEEDITYVQPEGLTRTYGEGL